MDGTWATDTAFAYVTGIVAGAPVGVSVAYLSGWDLSVTIIIGAAMLGFFARRRAMRRRLAAAASLIACLVLVTSCGKNPTAPSPVLATETFTGTVQVGATHSNKFTVNYAETASDASLTLNTLTVAATGASSTLTIGVGFGSLAFDGSCLRSAGFTAPTAILGHEMVATGAFGPGTYCVQVYDAGTLTEPLSYSLTVKHY